MGGMAEFAAYDFAAKGGGDAAGTHPNAGA